MLKYAPNPVPPEIRLEMAIVAAPFFAISFFWSAWTSYASVSFWAPMMAGCLLGWSICWIFVGTPRYLINVNHSDLFRFQLALFNYIIDAYLFVAASALAANTIVRSLAGAAFPLFATQMYEALGPQWTGTLIGCIALLLMPIPFVLVK